MPKIGELQWKRFGECRLGMRGNQILAFVRPGDDTFPTKVFDVSYPDRWFLDIEDAIKHAETHSRCTVHGIEGCGICTESETV